MITTVALMITTVTLILENRRLVHKNDWQFWNWNVLEWENGPFNFNKFEEFSFIVRLNESGGTNLHMMQLWSVQDSF